MMLKKVIVYLMIVHTAPMNQNCASQPVANQTEISCLAFLLWEKAGCPQGRDLEFWLGAETSLLPSRRLEPAIVETVSTKPSPGKVGLRVQSNTARQPLKRL